MGFPIGFNRNCPLYHDGSNHTSALQYPDDIDKYLEEEIQFGAIVGPFSVNPIDKCHVSPMMTRAKTDSQSRRVIIDLSWPRNASVNDGVDKQAYMGSEFRLTFPSLDDLTKELRNIGKGAHIFKIDVSRAFRHLNIDPFDFDLLGLHWHGAYLDTRLPFGTRHGSQFFQRTSDAVRYIMKCKGHTIINYIDDFLGCGTPTTAEIAFKNLFQLMNDLGLTISERKLVHPSTRAICLGIMVDTIAGTLSIPDEKLAQIKQQVEQWSNKTHCSKTQLQSLLGLLLYIHKCVKPARLFLNRMLQVLRTASNPQKIVLGDEFKRDLYWFQRFLQEYNGISLFTHRPCDSFIELDACLTGIGGAWKNFVYQMSIPLGYRQMGIVHLEMINIVVALKLFKDLWAGQKILIRCDNEAVVTVLKTGCTKEPFLGACARNVWFLAACFDINLQYEHVRGIHNTTADLLSRWQGSMADFQKLSTFVPNPTWLPVSLAHLDIDDRL